MKMNTQNLAPESLFRCLSSAKLLVPGVVPLEPNGTTFGVRFYWGSMKVLGFSPKFPDFASLKYLIAPFDESYYLGFFEN